MTQLNIITNADTINNILTKRHLLRIDRNGIACDDDDGGGTARAER